jgi:hypothetical protein
MSSAVINTRKDLDAIAGTPQHDAFMAMLAGTLWRIVKNDAAQAWVAVEDNSIIERFGFARTDFPDAAPPELPAYSQPPSDVPTVVTMRQARLALLQTGMLASVNAAVTAADEATKITWEFSSEVQRSNPIVSTLAAALNLTDAQIDDLFALAATL